MICDLLHFILNEDMLYNSQIIIFEIDVWLTILDQE